MPTYTYRCNKCGHRFDLFHGIKDETPRRCPRCRAKARRVPAGGAGLLFKGSGFYITDYRSSSYKEKARQEGSGGKAPEAKPGEGKASEAKPGEGKAPEGKARDRQTGGGPRKSEGAGERSRKRSDA